MPLWGPPVGTFPASIKECTRPPPGTAWRSPGYGSPSTHARSWPDPHRVLRRRWDANYGRRSGGGGEGRQTDAQYLVPAGPGAHLRGVHSRAFPLLLDDPAGRPSRHRGRAAPAWSSARTRPRLGHRPLLSIGTRDAARGGWAVRLVSGRARG